MPGCLLASHYPFAGEVLGHVAIDKNQTWQNIRVHHGPWRPELNLTGRASCFVALILVGLVWWRFALWICCSVPSTVKPTPSRFAPNSVWQALNGYRFLHPLGMHCKQHMARILDAQIFTSTPSKKNHKIVIIWSICLQLSHTPFCYAHVLSLDHVVYELCISINTLQGFFDKIFMYWCGGWTHRKRWSPPRAWSSCPSSSPSSSSSTEASGQRTPCLTETSFSG